MKTVAIVTAIYCAGFSVLFLITPGVTLPPLPQATQSKSGKSLPHTDEIKKAREKFRNQTPIWFKGLLGRDRIAQYTYRRMVRKHDAIEALLKQGKPRQNMKAVMGSLREMKQAREGLDRDLLHHSQWVSKVKIQLYLAFVIGLIGAVLAFLGLGLPGGIALMVAGIAPLLYGVVSQPFPAEPLVFSGPLLVVGVVFLILGIKGRKD